MCNPVRFVAPVKLVNLAKAMAILYVVALVFCALLILFLAFAGVYLCYCDLAERRSRTSTIQQRVQELEMGTVGFPRLYSN